VDLKPALAMLGAVTDETATKPPAQAASALAALLLAMDEVAAAEHIREFVTQIDLSCRHDWLGMVLQLKRGGTCSVYVCAHNLIATCSPEDKFDNSSSFTVDLAATAAYSGRLTELAQFILRRETRSRGT